MQPAGLPHLTWEQENPPSLSLQEAAIRPQQSADHLSALIMVGSSHNICSESHKILSTQLFISAVSTILPYFLWEMPITWMQKTNSKYGMGKGICQGRAALLMAKNQLPSFTEIWLSVVLHARPGANKYWAYFIDVLLAQSSGKDLNYEYLLITDY